MILPGGYVRVKGSKPVRTGRVMKFFDEPPQERCMVNVGDCNLCYNVKDLELVSDKEIIKELATALAFYANPDTYFAIGFFPDKPCGDFIEDFSETNDEYGKVVKPGDRARKTLKKYTSLLIEMDA